jgi:sugar/nucleoside kinase (ribokinase family)
MTNENKLDFLAIGDIVTDAFITIKDAEVSCDDNHENCRLSVRFGDKVPYESVDVVKAVGNSANASVAAARLGLHSALLTDMGDDQNGKDCLETLGGNGVSTDYVRVHKGLETNYHYVLRYGAERTILVKHHDYPYTMPDITPPPTWIYLSSLGESSLPYHEAIAQYTSKHPETKLVFQPGTFQIKLGYEKLRTLYEHTEIFFCNKEEAQRILQSTSTDIKELLEDMHNLGPKIVFITDGPRGAHTYDGKDMWFMPMYPDPKPPVSRTGAGDAFSSTCTVALALGKTLPEALQWGPINSAYVVQQIGAQKGLLTRAELERHLAEAPADYKAQKIN